VIAQVLLWISLALLAYIYVGYPLIVALLAWIRPRKVNVARWRGSISVVLVAHNEAPRIFAKLSNLFASTISDQILEVLVGSDGSTDSTADIAASFPDHRVQAIDFETRRGKAGVINDLATHCRGDVIVFVDARQDFAATALALMVENFSDPTVGVVSGELVFLHDEHSTTAAEGVGFYWNYEKWIRTAESNFRSVPGATGAIYALRNELFRPIPEQTLLDDVVIPMQVIEQGYRCVLEREAVAYDRPSPTSSRESIRKRRTIAGCAQLMLAFPRWLKPSKNPIWWEYCSHKLARLASPVLLAVAAYANARLITQPFYAFLLTVQLAFYIAAVVGWIYQYRGRRSQLFGPFLMFVSLNGTTLLALWDALCGRFRPAWQKSAA
jgi:cellulose synthase/poly-beta-1,6-N-acetylglucosamine synthase-like glycosyltransferase